MINEKIQKQFTGKKALVTGGTGLIGRQVVDILVHAGSRVKIVSLDKLRVNDHAEHIVGDLMNFEFCRSIMRDVAYVFHLAGVQGTVQTSSSENGEPFCSHPHDEHQRARSGKARRHRKARVYQLHRRLC